MIIYAYAVCAQLPALPARSAPVEGSADPAASATSDDADMPELEDLPASSKLKSRTEETRHRKGDYTYHLDDLPPGLLTPPVASKNGDYLDKLYLEVVPEMNLVKAGVTKLPHDKHKRRYGGFYPAERTAKPEYACLFLVIDKQAGISREQVEALMFHLFYHNRSVHQ